MANTQRRLSPLLFILILALTTVLSSGCTPGVEDHRGDKVAEDIDPSWYPIKD